jgi:hypothetical protein
MEVEDMEWVDMDRKGLVCKVRKSLPKVVLGQEVQRGEGRAQRNPSSRILGRRAKHRDQPEERCDQEVLVARRKVR